jgi:hypothetical protein
MSRVLEAKCQMSYRVSHLLVGHAGQERRKDGATTTTSAQAIDVLGVLTPRCSSLSTGTGTSWVHGAAPFLPSSARWWCYDTASARHDCDDHSFDAMPLFH